MKKVLALTAALAIDPCDGPDTPTSYAEMSLSDKTSYVENLEPCPANVEDPVALWREKFGEANPLVSPAKVLASHQHDYLAAATYEPGDTDYDSEGNCIRENGNCHNTLTVNGVDLRVAENLWPRRVFNSSPQTSYTYTRPHNIGGTGFLIIARRGSTESLAHIPPLCDPNKTQVQ